MPISIKRGDDEQIIFTPALDSGIDLTADKLWFTIRPRTTGAEPEPLLQLYLEPEEDPVAVPEGAGSLSLSGDDSQLLIDLDRSFTTTLTPGTTYECDVQVELANGKQKTPVVDSITVTKDVTRITAAPTPPE